MSIAFTITQKSTTWNLNNRADTFLLDPVTLETPTNQSNPVTDTFTVHLRSVSGSTIRQKITAYNQLFEQARQYPGGVNSVYLNLGMKGDAAAWRTRILDGAIVFDEKLTSGLTTNRMSVEIAITHLPFWEGPETVLALTNANGTNLTAGINVLNANDLTGTSPTKKCNYVDIAAASVAGELPTPIKLQLKNTYASALGAGWIGLNNTNPATCRWLYEAEASIIGTPIVSSGSSGGYIVSGNISDLAATKLLEWTFTRNEMTAFAGQMVRFCIRSSINTDYDMLKFKIKLISGSTTLFESDWVKSSEGENFAWLELFELRLPPWLVGMDSIGQINLQLFAKAVLPGLWKWGFDDLMLMPADSFLHFKTLAATNALVTLDGIEGVTYLSDSSGDNRVGLQEVRGGLILQPGKANRLYFLSHSTTADIANTAHSMQVIAWYRPRRLTI